MSVHLEVALVVFAREPGKTSPCVLVRRHHNQFSLPVAPLGDQSSLQAAAKLLQETVGLRARILGQGGWINLVQIPIADAIDRVRGNVQHGAVATERVITIPYGAMMPLDYADVSGGSDLEWKSLHDAIGSPFVMDHLEILMAAARQV